MQLLEERLARCRIFDGSPRFDTFLRLQQYASLVDKYPYRVGVWMGDLQSRIVAHQEISIHALLSTTNMKEFSVLFQSPFVIQSLALEGLVKSHPVTLGLRVHQHAVTVKQESLRPE